MIFYRLSKGLNVFGIPVILITYRLASAGGTDFFRFCISLLPGRSLDRKSRRRFSFFGAALHNRCARIESHCLLAALTPRET
jgi:hypothetical protein